MTLTSQNIIDMFVSGETNAVSGTKYNPGNVRIKNNQIFHYETPILERTGDKYIFNLSRYSLQTSMIQKKIRETINSDRLIVVNGVPKGFEGSLKEYINKED